MTSTDGERIGRLLRLIRQRERLTQRALAGIANVPREDVIAVEAGRLGQLPFDRTRRMFEAVGARARPAVWWNGAAADRLLDERHAFIVERSVRAFAQRNWETAVEVSFADYGERRSIDILAARESAARGRGDRSQIQHRIARGDESGPRHEGASRTEDRRGAIRMAPNRGRTNSDPARHDVHTTDRRATRRNDGRDLPCANH